jgi:hypothetical protein
MKTRVSSSAMRLAGSVSSVIEVMQNSSLGPKRYNVCSRPSPELLNTLTLPHTTR